MYRGISAAIHVQGYIGCNTCTGGYRLQYMYRGISAAIHVQGDIGCNTCTGVYRLQYMYRGISAAIHVQGYIGCDTCTGVYRLRYMYRSISAAIHVQCTSHIFTHIATDRKYSLYMHLAKNKLSISLNRLLTVITLNLCCTIKNLDRVIIHVHTCMHMYALEGLVLSLLEYWQSG